MIDSPSQPVLAASDGDGDFVQMPDTIAAGLLATQPVSGHL
jgi:hypothetical protein